VNVQIPPTATWDDLIQAWHQQVEAVGLTAHTRLPKVSSGYEFHDSKGNVLLNLSDSARIYAYTVVPIPDPPAPVTPIDLALLNRFKMNVLYSNLTDKRTLWQTLSRVSKRHKRIEWSLVKDHIGN
jgi:hypothetical protein